MSFVNSLSSVGMFLSSSVLRVSSLSGCSSLSLSLGITFFSSSFE
jgi:hypothetical protein